MHVRNYGVPLVTGTVAKQVREIVIIIFSAFLVASGLRLFLIPHQLLSGGVAGVASVAGYLTNPKFISLIYFAINLPILIWGFIVVGKKYICLSMLSVLATTWFLNIIPVVQLTKDPILASIFGGVIIAGGVGFSLRAGGSSGGFDILGSIITRKHDIPMGSVLFVMDGLVILSLGFFKSWDSALYAMLCIFVKSRVVDMIHIRHVKLTCFIVTKERDRMLESLTRLPHGVTVVNTEGGYSHEGNAMLMTVTTRYELATLRKTILETDPKSFVNVLQTVEIVGRFRRMV
ncbi:YitT family protein [Paenibacillus sp. 19GGS1-52]|uniref:YitT family protein n=1 Tax=Paenibacillus sp. 19GGS1-52 TaxID=2758563 RepID=UPI001EFB6940|nr:YitT family protein [Paenibacillus sp. 19GGS1-52]ULO09136.1 YitT family protein [Paenibacillus sp. 19GGS1-52]